MSGISIGKIAIGIGSSSGGGWTPQRIVSKLLYWGKVSEISGGHMPNKVTGATDYITIGGSAGSYTFQVPNTAPYIAADTDNIWFKTDASQRTTTEAELVAYDLPRTPVKYDDNSPNLIREIIIFKLGETLTVSERDHLFAYMQLPIMWDNSLSIYGHVKDNRGPSQQLWAVYESEINTYISGLSTELSGPQLTLLNNLVLELKSGLSIGSLSDYFDCLWVIAGETKESSYKNIVKNAHHVTASAEPTWTLLEGSQGDGTTQFLNTNYNPATQAVNFTQNNAGVIVYIRNTVNEAKSDVGLIDPITLQTIAFSHYSGTLSCCLNQDAATQVITEVTTSAGVSMVTRNGATVNDLYLYKNKTSIGTRSGIGSTIGILNGNVYIGALHRITLDAAILFSTRQYAFVGICKHITTSDRDVIVDAFETYMDANGKGVI